MIEVNFIMHILFKYTALTKKDKKVKKARIRVRGVVLMRNIYGTFLFKS